MNITKILLEWYGDHKRDLPWRKTRDPYLIWVSEIILQQTRVEQGLEYYLNFVDKYPDIRSLARASEQEVLKMWQGLGYYSRARNMLSAAKIIFVDYGGTFPADYNNILKLKGIGQYTAGAIASIAFNQPFPAMDGNVKRVISRLFGVDTPVNSGKGAKRINEILLEMIDHHKPGDFNQAIMEFGALNCKPKNPLCDTCPLSHACQAHLSGRVDKLPVMDRKIKQKRRSFHYLVMLSKNKKELVFMIRKRTGNDIWKNMYDFPELETFESYKNNSRVKLIKTSSVYKHQLTHQLISAKFYIYYFRSLFTVHRSPEYIAIGPGQLDQYPFPRLIDKFIQQELMPEIKKMQD